MADSLTTQIKKNLVDDLVANSDNVEYAIPYSVLPDQLDDRDGFKDHAICLYEGVSRANVNTGASFPHEIVQQYVVMVYARTHRLKGSEGEFEGFFDSLKDDVYQWLESLANNNRISVVTDSQLRVPNRNDNARDFFEDKEEQVNLGNSTYTNFHFQTIRKAQTNGSQ